MEALVGAFSVIVKSSRRFVESSTQALLATINHAGIWSGISGESSSIPAPSSILHSVLGSLTEKTGEINVLFGAGISNFMGQWPVPVFMNFYLHHNLFFVRNIKLMLFYILVVTSALEVLKGETGRLNWSLENWGSLTWHFSRVQYSVKVFRLSENPREVSGLRYDHMMVSSSTHQFMGIKKSRQRIILPPVTTQCLLNLHSIISYQHEIVNGVPTSNV